MPLAVFFLVLLDAPDYGPLRLTAKPRDAVARGLMKAAARLPDATTARDVDWFVAALAAQVQDQLTAVPLPVALELVTKTVVACLMGFFACPSSLLPPMHQLQAHRVWFQCKPAAGAGSLVATPIEMLRRAGFSVAPGASLVLSALTNARTGLLREVQSWLAGGQAHALTAAEAAAVGRPVDGSNWCAGTVCETLSLRSPSAAAAVQAAFAAFDPNTLQRRRRWTDPAPTPSPWLLTAYSAGGRLTAARVGRSLQKLLKHLPSTELACEDRDAGSSAVNVLLDEETPISLAQSPLEWDAPGEHVLEAAHLYQWDGAAQATSPLKEALWSRDSAKRGIAAVTAAIPDKPPDVVAWLACQRQRLQLQIRSSNNKVLATRSDARFTLSTGALGYPMDFSDGWRASRGDAGLSADYDRVNAKLADARQVLDATTESKAQRSNLSRQLQLYSGFHYKRQHKAANKANQKLKDALKEPPMRASTRTLNRRHLILPPRGKFSPKGTRMYGGADVTSHPGRKACRQYLIKALADTDAGHALLTDPLVRPWALRLQELLSASAEVIPGLDGQRQGMSRRCRSFALAARRNPRPRLRP
jgi:hypothetical protein